jgi:hypothetical protein
MKTLKRGFLTAAGLIGLLLLALGSNEAPKKVECGSDQCKGTDGACYGPCQQGFCTLTPSGQCSLPSKGGVYCCSGGSSTGTGCTARVCCGGLYECNGRCYSECTPGSQPCCTNTNCTCYTPCC